LKAAVGGDTAITKAEYATSRIERWRIQFNSLSVVLFIPEDIYDTMSEELWVQLLKWKGRNPLERL
jgi:hypothetical protein